MPNIVKENMPNIWTGVLTLLAAIGASWTLVEAVLDNRYIEAEESREIVEMVIAPHLASDGIHTEIEVTRQEFDQYKENAKNSFQLIDDRLVRMDGKMDRLIEMQLSQ
jgi:hypothetical protein